MAQGGRTPGVVSKKGSDQQVRWLIVSSSKGGCGKTTLSRNIAVFAAHEGFRVHTLDLDGQQALTRWVERRPEEAPQIHNHSVQLSKLSDAMPVLEALNADLLVVDTPPGVEWAPVEMKRLLARADLVLVPTQPSDDDIESAVEWMNFLRREEIRAFYVLNRVKRASRSLEDAKLALLESGGALSPIEIRDLEDIKRTAKVGIGILELRKAAGQDDMRGVWLFARTEIGLARSPVGSRVAQETGAPRPGAGAVA